MPFSALFPQRSRVRKFALAPGRGKFVTLEGVEGSGKSTQLQAISKILQSRGVRVLVTREPGGTWLGNELRDILLRNGEEPIDPLAELLLMEAARAQHVSTVLRPALNTHDLVLCDRFVDSTVAYQSAGRGLAPAMVKQLNRLASGELIPDLTFLLDLSAAEGLRRTLARETSGTDRFEQEGRAFHERVQKAYLEQARHEPQRIVVVDGTAPAEQITREIIRKIEALLKLGTK